MPAAEALRRSVEFDCLYTRVCLRVSQLAGDREHELAMREQLKMLDGVMEEIGSQPEPGGRFGRWTLRLLAWTVQGLGRRRRRERLLRLARDMLPELRQKFGTMPGKMELVRDLEALLDEMNAMGERSAGEEC